MSLTIRGWSEGYVTIQLSENQKMQNLVIYNSLGIDVYNKIFSESTIHSIELDIGTHLPGLYYVKMNINGIIWGSRIILTD